MDRTMPVGEEGEYAAHQLRNLHLGTEAPEVAWQDAPESERAAWMMLAGLIKSLPPQGVAPPPLDRQDLHRRIQWTLSGASVQTAVAALLDSLAATLPFAVDTPAQADAFLDHALPLMREGMHRDWDQARQLRAVATEMPAAFDQVREQLAAGAAAPGEIGH